MSEEELKELEELEKREGKPNPVRRKGGRRIMDNSHTWRQEGPVLLRDDERIDDLQRNHYGIIQRKGTFCFGMDAVLLSGFAQVKPGEHVLDLGTEQGLSLFF